MNLALVLLGYVSYKRNKKTVKSDYSLDSLQEKELLSMAFSRYWPTEELHASHAQMAEGLHTSAVQEAEVTQEDDFQGQTKAAILNSDFDQVKISLHKAKAAGTPDSEFYEAVAEFYYSQADLNKYGVWGNEYLLALNKLLEFHENDGKYLIGRADFYKKREDYDAARVDYNHLMGIYPDDLWIPYAIVYTYRKQEMKEEAKAYLKYIKKNLSKIQARLQIEAGSGDDCNLVKSVIDSNDQVGKMAKELLKFKKA